LLSDRFQLIVGFAVISDHGQMISHRHLAIVLG
jgi:hypothetical protein